MQIVNYENIEKRILYYLSRMYTSNLSKGRNYKELHKCVGIVFIDFELEKLKEIPKYITKWNIRETKYSHIILTDAIEIYIIEMPKVKQYAKDSKLDIWLKFITEMEEIYMKEEYNDIEGIKEAKKVIKEISSDENERYLAHLREKYVLDMNSMVSEGYDKGIKQGQKEAMKETAKKLKEEKIDIDIIAKCTGLSKEEIKKL